MRGTIDSHWFHTWVIWNGYPIKKLKTRHIWDYLCFMLPEIPWHKWVWHYLNIIRYAHLEWLVCLDRLSTFECLVSFGIDIQQECLLCVGRIESLSHIFLKCHFSHHVLQPVMAGLHTTVEGDTWLEALAGVQSWT